MRDQKLVELHIPLYEGRGGNKSVYLLSSPSLCVISVNKTPAVFKQCQGETGRVLLIEKNSGIRKTKQNKPRVEVS